MALGFKLGPPYVVRRNAGGVLVNQVEIAIPILGKSDRLIGLLAHGNNAAKRYVMIHDSAGAPPNGAVPILSVPLVADQNLSFDFTAVSGLNFPVNGEGWLSLSDTDGTLTLSADLLWYTAFLFTTG